MNKKGFTLVELLAVIVILGILCSVATLEVFRYKRFTNEKEVVNLRSTIEECYDNYRNSTIVRGDIPDDEITNGDVDIFNNYFNELSYNGKKLKLDDIEFQINLEVKGELLSSQYACYHKNREGHYAEDKTCIVKTEISKTIDSTTGHKTLSSVCENPLKPSKDEVLCIKLKIKDYGENGKMLMDDYGDSNKKDSGNKENLCYYFKHKSIDSTCGSHEGVDVNE